MQVAFTPETLPVGVMASTLLDVYKERAQYVDAFIPYEPCEPTDAPQVPSELPKP